jgi:HD-GYP domain-containing protein (c-di-GMP phosphodiesterase class II)
LNSAENQKEPLAWLQTQLRKTDYFWVEIIHDTDSHLVEQTVERGEKARWMYSSALASIKEVVMKISSQKRAGIQQAKRIVQNMVDILIEEDTILLSLSTMRDYDDYTYTHSVNVALLSMCLGKRIGLSKILLERLGISGIFHDLGKVAIPHDLINKPDKLTEEEFDLIREHPINSVLQIIKINAARDLKNKIILPPFEHHLMYDFSGYPQIANKMSISLFGRILTITDIFDAMTSPRIYRPIALSPDKVVRIMLDESGKRFDPILLKAFINMLGVYPVGTLLLLDTGELCLVMETPEDDELARPVVIILNRDQEGKYSKGDVVNLTEQDPQSGVFCRNIVKSYHPSTYGIQPTDFLI